MNTVKVYRVEMIDGTGPYRIDTVGPLARFLCVMHSDWSQHPPMTADFHHSQWGPENFFGFKNLDQLFDWFEDVIEAMIGKGFYISEYTCRSEDINDGKSNKQIIFIKERALLTSQIEI